MSKEKIEQIKKFWDKARANKSTGSFTELDDGRYITVINDAEVNESQSSDRLQIMIAFKVQEGEFEGKTKRMYVGLDSEVGVQIVVNTLNRLGVDVENPEDLEESIKDVIGKVCKIQLKTKPGKGGGEFQNVFILKVMGEDSEVVAGGKAVAEPEPEPEEDAPAKPKGKGKEKPIPASEPTPAEGVEEVSEEVELKAGMKVVFNLNKKEVEGKVSKVEEDKGTAIVEYNGKKYRVPGDQLLLK